jgi:hypothetical protein
LRDLVRRPAVVVAAALVVSALSLLAPWAIAFDAWSWIIWGREVTRLGLDTAGGPSWKPLSVVFTTVFALFGSAAPALWLIAARAGGLLALGGVAALAHRLAGPVAAAIAPVLMLVSDWWLFHTYLGNSEGMLAAAAAWAIVAHLDGRHQAALGLGVAAGLIRPEAWPFAGLYALWAWRRAGMSFWAAAAWLALLPILWFGPDLTGSGGALGASDAALAYAAPASAANAAVPVLEVWRDVGGLLTVPVLVAAALGVWLGGRTERMLLGMACAWVLIVGVLSQAGYPGNPRYNVPAAVIGCALAAAGVVRLARWHAPARGPGVAVALGAGLTLLVLGANWGALRDQVEGLGDRVDRRKDLDTLVERNGGAAQLRACAPIHTVQGMRAMVAWRLDVRMAPVSEGADPPVALFQAPSIYRPYDADPAYEGVPPEPEPVAPPGLAATDRVGDWTLRAACR